MTLRTFVLDMLPESVVVETNIALMSYVPYPNFIFRVAVPALVNWTFPKRPMPELQSGIEALQNFTVPLVTAVGFVTVAVRVTTVPTVTELPGETVRIVVVVTAAQDA